MSASVTCNDVKAVLLDIEGTTTSISFVKDTLFPYVRAVLRDHLNEQWGSDELRLDIDSLRQLQQDDELTAGDDGVNVPPRIDDSKDDDQLKASVMAFVTWLMDSDRKATALKQLQGKGQQFMMSVM